MTFELRTSADVAKARFRCSPSKTVAVSQAVALVAGCGNRASHAAERRMNDGRASGATTI
jgi:hypothetical protein